MSNTEENQGEMQGEVNPYAVGSAARGQAEKVPFDSVFLRGPRTKRQCRVVVAAQYRLGVWFLAVLIAWIALGFLLGLTFLLALTPVGGIVGALFIWVFYHELITKRYRAVKRGEGWSGVLNEDGLRWWTTAAPEEKQRIPLEQITGWKRFSGVGFIIKSDQVAYLETSERRFYFLRHRLTRNQVAFIHRVLAASRI